MRGSIGAAAVTAAALALTLAGCGSDDSDSSASSKPELKVSGVYMPAPVTDTMAAGFFTVTNAAWHRHAHLGHQ